MRFNKRKIIYLISPLKIDSTFYQSLKYVLKQKKVSYFDKQYFRDYLKSINWTNHQISIPDKIKESIISRYSDVLEMLTDE